MMKSSQILSKITLPNSGKLNIFRHAQIGSKFLSLSCQINGEKDHALNPGSVTSMQKNSYSNRVTQSITHSNGITETVTLSNGVIMPMVGFGTSRHGEDLKAVEVALDEGYRLIDTAYFYRNEVGVGENIARWIAKGGGKREETFVVTKLPPSGMRPEDVKPFLQESLVNLGLDYIDLYLIHTPTGMMKSTNDKMSPKNKNLEFEMDHATDHIAIWKAMEALVDEGLARTIGLSNFSLKQVRKILAVSRIQPAVLQTELHVAYQQKELVSFCQDNNVTLMSYASLGSPGRNEENTPEAIKKIDMLGHPVVQLIADNHQVTTAQILLKFWVQQGVNVIPKSCNPQRIASNKKLFGWLLSDTEMKALKTLDLGPEGKLFIWDRYSSARFHPEFSNY